MKKFTYFTLTELYKTIQPHVRNNVLATCIIVYIIWPLKTQELRDFCSYCGVGCIGFNK